MCGTGEITVGGVSNTDIPDMIARRSLGAESAMRFGTKVCTEGGVQFRLFAPDVDSVCLILEDTSESLPMSRDDGWFEATARSAGAGTRYTFRLASGTVIPDPASRYQPYGSEGMSEVVAPDAYQWSDAGWAGLSWNEAVIYELHLGTFTPEGTFRSAISRLQHLADIGITAIELMCLTQFPSTKNWGYDVALLFAPSNSYGRPEDLKALVDEAHHLGIMVILDVVYNHLCDVGNCIPTYWSNYMSPQHKNAWGRTPNFDRQGATEVREFVISNALYWIDEFHFDGLRLDAANDMKDESPRHILDELADKIHRTFPNRAIHLILEDQDNAADRIAPPEEKGYTGYSAQWNHDMAHLRELPLPLAPDAVMRKTETVANMLARGFCPEHNPVSNHTHCTHPTDFVGFLQTHDLVGNDVRGQRVYAKASTAATRALTATYFVSPQIPMLFMGDEWCASTPFCFFADLEEDAMKGVRKSRHDFLRSNGAKEDDLRRMPDPAAEETFTASRLNWGELDDISHATWLAWFKRLSRTRREVIIPLLQDTGNVCTASEVYGAGCFRVTWSFGEASLVLYANLSEHIMEMPELPQGNVFWSEGDPFTTTAGPWSVRWSIRN